MPTFEELEVAIAALVSDNAVLISQRRVEKAREYAAWLRTYGQHTDACATRDTPTPGTCDCGWAEIEPLPF